MRTLLPELKLKDLNKHQGYRPSINPAQFHQGTDLTKIKLHSIYYG